MKVSIDIGYDPQTISTVTEFLRKVEAFIATEVDKRLIEMPCKDDDGNLGWSLMQVPIEGFEYLDDATDQEFHLSQEELKNEG